ncbi:hypothetical protein B9T33_08495 [Acinetobacter sp. ANC 5054]|uniref:GA-like domain-containing protein n=1 Tax=Acinetobacter sp. ANC 5054 TaxID=1977877 RepID=UPI000A3548C1|nr:BapA prefix-like domain-containing protein [Acinetobacter sp. ANC 5054]OTG80460.1 hypothetical protein B9T33_08495 [Acinetobacter sp. ANC 5054]
MLQVQVVSKEHHSVLENIQTSNISLKEASVVVIHTSKENVLSMERSGNTLIIKMKDGQQLIIENYFTGNTNENNVVLEEDDKFYLLETNQNEAGLLEINYNPIDEINPLLYSDSTVGLWTWLVPLVTAGGVLALASNDSDSSSSPANSNQSIQAAEKAVKAAEEANKAAEDALKNAQVDGLITPEEKAKLEQALADAKAAEDAAQKLVDSLKDSIDKDGLQDRIDALTDISIPAVTDADGNGIDDTVDAQIADAEAAVKAAEEAYQAAEDALEEANANGLITPTEKAELEDALKAAQDAKDAAQDAVDALPTAPAAVQDAKDGFQDRIDALTDITIPAVNDANENGIDDSTENPVDLATDLVEAAEDAYQAAADALTEANTDGLITPEEKAELEDALKDAQDAKDAAQDAVDALPDSADKDGLQDRIDALTDISIPAVTDADGNGIDDTVDAQIADAEAAVKAAEEAYQAAEDALEEANANGLITPTEKAELEDALKAAQDAKDAAQDAVDALPSAPAAVQDAKDGFQDRIDALTDITIPAVNDANENGIDDSTENPVDLATDLVEAAEAAYTAAEQALADALSDEAITQDEVNALIDARDAAQTAKADAQAAVDGIAADYPVQAAGFQDRLDALTDISIPTVNDTDDNGIPDDIQDVADLVAAAEAAYTAAEQALADALSDEAITQDEVNALTAARDAAQTAKADAQAAVDGIAADYPVQAAGFQDRLDALTDISIPTVNDTDDNGIPDDIQDVADLVAAAEAAYTAAEQALADALSDEAITQDEVNALTAARDAAQTAKADAQAAVDGIAADYPVQAAGFQDRLDALTDIEIPTVNELDIKAVDDLDEVLISPDNPLSTPDNLNGTVGQTFAIANADLVSGLIDLSLLTSNEDFNFEVEPNTTQSVTIGVSGSTGLDLSSLGGVLAGLAASLLLGKSYTTQADIYLINSETGEIVDVASDKLTLTPLALTTTISASNVQFDNIPPGNYTVAFSSTDPDSILGALLNAIADVGLLEGIRVTITDSEQFYGASITGNVLTNDDDEGEHGGVVVPATVVGVASEVVSAEQAVDPSQPTVIQGQHGVLTIESDGSYTYVPNNLISSLGKVDTFTYTIDDGQHQSTANLNIRITQDGLEVVWDDDNPTADGVIPNDIDAIEDLATASWTTVNNNLGSLSGSTFALANVEAIFNTIGGSLLSSTNEFVLNVEENTSQDFTFNVSGSTGLDLASLGSTLAGIVSSLILGQTYETFADIYLIDLNTGDIVQTATGALKLTPALFTTTITAENVAFNNVPPGNYTIGFSSTDANSILGTLLNAIADVGVLEGVDVTVSSSKLYVYGNVEGNVFDNDDITFDHVGEVLVTAIASETTAEQGVFNVAKSIQGQHGTLTISQDGSFKYVGNGDPASLGKVDSFTYTLSDGIHTDMAVLNIRTTADGLDVTWGANDAADGTVNFDAVDDEKDITIAVVNVVNEDVIVPVTTTGTVGTTYTDTTPSGILGSYTRTYTNSFTGSQSFTVNPDTTVTGTASINIGLVSSSIVDLSNSWGTVTATYTISGPNGVIENGSGSLVREGGLRGDYIATADFTNLPAGTYTISYNVTNVTTAAGTAITTPSNNGAFTVDPAVVTVDETLLTVYETVPGAYSVTGDILGNDAASDFAKLEIVQGESTYVIQHGHIYVNGILQNTNSVDIAGDYGTLKLKADGTYTYTASTVTNVWGNTEEFTYTLTDAGQTDTASISIELISDNPAAMTVLSARMALADSDTVIFDLLDNTDDRGGNDLKTLDDFDSTQGDQIDISALLSDQNVDSSTLANYISLEQRGDDTVVIIDRDGSSADQTFARADLLILSNTNAQDLILQDLIKYQS